MILADLVIGFRMIHERYTSRVTLQPPQRIEVTYVEGFLSLSPRAPSAQWAVLTFHIEFEFRSKPLQSLMGVFFTRQ